MEKRPALRASDSDRELVGERLRHAATEGRLATEELEERLTALFSSRTYDELDRLVADLPEPETASVPARVKSRRREKALSTAGAAIAALTLLIVLAALGTREHAGSVRLPNGHVIAIGHGPNLIMMAAPLLALLFAVLAAGAMGLAVRRSWRHGGPPNGQSA